MTQAEIMSVPCWPFARTEAGPQQKDF